MTQITAVANLTSKRDIDGAGEQVQLGFNADYNDERNKEWARYTPGLSVTMTVIGSVAENFDLGGRYLLTFVKQD